MYKVAVVRFSWAWTCAYIIMMYVIIDVFATIAGWYDISEEPVISKVLFSKMD